MEEAKVFNDIYKDYLNRVASRDWAGRADVLGIDVAGQSVEIDLFNQRFTITPEAVADMSGQKPHHAVSVLLCQYLLLSPQEVVAESRNLVTYKDFKDALPYVQGFSNTAENPIARHFGGNLSLLEERCRTLGGTVFKTDVSCDLTYAFQALPKVGGYLFFTDTDEEFPASCTLLFQDNAPKFLDMECIAIIGGVLAEWLKKQP